MRQIIFAIIKKANEESCLNGSYESHQENSLLFGVNIRLTTGQIVIISNELIQDFSKDNNINVCGRIKLQK